MSETITDVAAERRQSSGPDETRDGVSRVKQLQAFGQSVWLDYLRRSLFTSGEFRRLIVEDGLRGATSNPSIFEKAIAGSTDYLVALQEIERRHDIEPMALYEALAIGDIRDAADLLLPEYEATKRADGYVSLEVSPYIAHDTQATIEEARRLWKAVDRHNVMIKVPATVEGVPAIRQLVSEGININITLLFGIGRYEEVAHAYIDGLSTFVKNGGDTTKVASVASFFVSRIDTKVDDIIAKKLTAITDSWGSRIIDRPPGERGDCQRKARIPDVLRPLPHAGVAATGRPRVRIRNVCCGQAPAPRILVTATFAMSRN